MLLAFLLAFPALTYILVSLKTEDRTTRNAALLLSIPFALYYFRNPLHTGTIDTFMAAPLLILTLIAVELMYKKTRFATFLLTVSLALTFYAHIGIFVLSGAFIALELFTRPEKEKYLPRFIAAAVFTFLLTINFSYFFLSHLHCFSVSNSTFLKM